MKAENSIRQKERSFHAKTPSLGLFAWFGMRIPFPDRMVMIKDAGFDFTSLWWEEDDETRRRLRHLAPELVRNAGLHIDNLHAPYAGCNELWSENDDNRQTVLERHLGWVEDCARHKVSTLVMHVTQGNGTPPPNAQGLESVRRIVERGEDRGVTIALENTRSPGHLDWLFEQIDSPRLGLCYDSSHDWLYSPDPGRLLRRWGTRLAATHLSDTDGRRDRHWLPGKGVVGFSTLCDAHSWNGFPGCFLLEVVPDDRHQGPAAFLADAYTAATAVTQALRA